MIRSAEYDDIPQLCALLSEFNESVTGVSPPKKPTYDLVSKCVNEGVVFVSDKNDWLQGVIVGHVFHHPFWDRTILQEVAWYSKDKSGYDLLKAFVKEAKKRNITSVYFTVVEPVSERMEKVLLNRIGFNKLERSYIMDI